MRPYIAMLSARFRLLLQYRVAAIAGLCTQIFWGLIRMMIFMAFYASTDAPQPMELADVVSYVWLGQAMLLILPWNVDPGMRDIVRSGNVAYELLRPVDLFSFWYARNIAQRTAPVLFRCVPMFIIAGLFFGLQAPDSVASLFAWLAATAGAVMLAAAINTILAVTLMWTVTGQGVTTLTFAAIIVFSGIVIPIPLFPDWAQPILYTLPFAGLMDLPFRLYIGHIPPNEVFLILGHQLLWTCAIVATGKYLLSRGVRRVEIMGG